MKKSLFLVTVSLSIGWFSHLLYSQNSSVKALKNPLQTPIVKQLECEESHEKIVYKTIEKEVIKYVPKTKIVYQEKKKVEDNNSTQKDKFMIALAKNKFYDAMSYYEEADEEKHQGYQTALVGYFFKIERKNLNKTLEEMRYFIDMESNSRMIVFQLVALYEKIDRVKDAIALLINYSYQASYQEIPLINRKIKRISINYISKLHKEKSYKELIAFLKHQINLGVLPDFFSFELAKAYFAVKKYLLSLELLTPLQESDIYKERATQLSGHIKIKLEELREYPIRIPLLRQGSHFLVKAYVENTPVMLLIDTGASITTINYNIVKGLKVLKEDVSFQTAGGNIEQNVFQADSFNIGSVSLKNFQIVGATYMNQNHHGLLGMNFLGQFKFKIDQKEALLLLGQKY